MFRYFGPLRPGTKVREGEWVVELRCIGDNCTYLRYSQTGGERVEEVLGGIDEIYLYPDIYGGEGSYYLYLDLGKDILLAPDSETMIMTGTPISIKTIMIKRFIVKDVASGKEWVEERRYVIDRIPFSKVSYAIYGSPERGVLARYYRVKIGSWLVLREAPLELHLTNVGDKVERLKRIVFPVLLPKLFFVPQTGKVAVSPLKVEIEKGIATVSRLSDEPPKEGYVSVPESGKIARWIAVYGL